MKNTNNFTPTAEMLIACEAVLVAQAYVDVIKPVVRDYQHKILADMQAISTRDGKIITEEKYTYQMNDDDFDVYLNRCEEEMIKNKLHVQREGNCPLVEAENMLGIAHKNLIDSIAPIWQKEGYTLTHEQLCYSGLDKLYLAIDIAMRLLCPFLTLKQDQQNV